MGFDNILSMEDRRAVSKEIIDFTQHYLHGIFDGSNPSNNSRLPIEYAFLKRNCDFREEKL